MISSGNTPAIEIKGMAGEFFRFKQFIVRQDRCAFKVGTDGVLLGASASVAGKTRILDIGSGTGLIALMLAQRSSAIIYAIEPDDGSFGQLTENVAATAWADRINIVHTRLQDYKPGILFDLIVSNPPYFRDSLRNADRRKSDARHDDSLPHEALLEGASRLLSPDGIFEVIMPYAEGNVLIAEAAGYGLFCSSIVKVKPLATSDIRRLIIAFSRKKLKPAEKFLVIEQGERHDFTDDYRELTRDFYLKF